MLNLTKPRYVFPFHGDYKRIRLHGELAESVGIDPDNIFRGRNGLTLEITEKGARFGKDVKAGVIFVDGVDIGDPDDVALRDRRTLSADGVFIVVATVSADDGEQVSDPEIIFRGVPVPRAAGGRESRRRAARRGRGHPRRRRRGRGQRGGPAPGGPPRRHRRVRLQAAAPPADDPARRRRGLSLREGLDEPSRSAARAGRFTPVSGSSSRTGAGIEGISEVRRAAIVVAAAAAALVAAPSAGASAPAVDAALKGADAPSAQLKTTATKTLPGGTVVNRFAQEVGGVPVIGAGTVVDRLHGRSSRAAVRQLEGEHRRCRARRALARPGDRCGARLRLGRRRARAARPAR